MNEFFPKNVDILQQILPEVAEQVVDCDTSNVNFCETRVGLPNLEKLIDGQRQYYHSNYDPVKEAERWFKQLQLTDVSVLFVYGVGLGYYYDAVQQWLRADPSRYLVFLEDDLAVIHRLLETERGTKILRDRQVQLHYFEALEHSTPMIDWILGYFIQLQFEISCLDYYSREKGDIFSNLRRQLSHEAVVKNSMVAEYLRHGRSFFHNFYSNLLHLPRSFRGNALFGQFKKVPAIICGAGPSLNNNLSVLRTLTDRALIFAGGSSVNALTAQGVIPHFGAGIDPNPPQLNRLLNNQAYEVPFFYRGRMFHLAFQAIHGPRLHITGSGGYHVAEWFEKKLDITGDDVEEGHNVITFCMEIAHRLGCDPIIFVGMDLAYTQMQSYASGVIDNPDVQSEDILDIRDMDSAAFIRQDIFGQPIYTLWKWVTESEWISTFAKERPQTTMINATEGGLGFPGVPNMTLEAVKKNFLSRTFDLRNRVHGEIAHASMPQVTSERVMRLLKELHDSLWRCIEHCDAVFQEIENIEKQLTVNKESLSTLRTRRAEELEEALLAECGFEYVLKIFNEVYSKVLNKEIHQVKHDTSLTSNLARNLKRLDINKKKFNFLRDTAITNIDVMQTVIDNHRLAGNDVTPFVQDSIAEVSP